MRELLDKIYELEGLVHLALKREKDSSDFIHLIKKKGKDIAAFCDQLETSQPSSPLDDSYHIEESESIDQEIENSEINQESYILDEYSLDDQEDDENERSTIVSKSKKPDNHMVKKQGRLVFSVNDRFRYKRELFGNSDVEFNNTLALIASMEFYEEAEDYFLNEVGLEKSNPVVIEFLDIIKKYFR